MKKVIISVTNDLVSDQRINKVANSLISNNFHVLVVGRKFRNSLEINRKYPIKRFRLLFTKGPLFYAEYNIRLFLFLIFTKADIYLANDLDTLAANFFASKIKRKKLVYDSHEYFTQVPELINRPKVQKIWLRIEKYILPKIKNSYTVCNSIAEIYSKMYSIEMKVVRNIPNSKINQITDNNETVEKSDEKLSEKKIILYQGSVNVGRGIEFVIKSMQYIENAEFWIIGDGDIKKALEKLTHELNLNQKVIFFGKIPFENLDNYTSKADLGISLEENLGLNYFYALPNKIFDYIAAKIPILASNLPEISYIINKYDIGAIINNHDIYEISSKINEILQNEEKIKIWKKNLQYAANELKWQNEEIILIEIFNNLYK